jgi:dipeptide/tripeptide permease
MSSDLDTGFFGHPRGLRTLFFTEMWERFSYYGMRAILMLFMTTAAIEGGLGFPPSKAAPIYAMYTSLVYLLSVPGGWVADNLLGQRKAVLYGGVVIMIGHILLAMHGMTAFYSGLGCVVIGTGLLKPNISAIVGQLYTPEDKRRDAGFSIFYMGINVGAFSAPLICGNWLAQSESWKSTLEGWGMNPLNCWHWGFGAAAVGMFFGLVQYVLTGRNLGQAGLRPAKPATAKAAAAIRRTVWIGALGTVALIAGLFLFNRTASYAERITWTAVPGHEYQLEGLTGSEETLDFEAGEKVEIKAIRVALGEEIAQQIESGAQAGATSGRVEGLGLGLGDKTIGAIEWTASRKLAFVVKGDIDGEEIVFHGPDAPMKSDDFEAEIGKERMADVVASVDEGTLTGTLGDVSFKHGGLNGGNIDRGYMIAILLIVILFFAKLLLGGDWTPNERARLITIFVLFCGAAVFWGVFEQAGSTLTLFAERSTVNSIFGIDFNSSAWQSVNALFIVLLAPFFAWMWTSLGKRNPSDPAKFSVGLLFAGLGFLVLVGGAMNSSGWQRVSPLWLLSVYFLHTVGELCLSPVGLSSMTKLAPARVVGLMMGVWFLAASVGNYISGSVAGVYEDLALPSLFAYIAAGAGLMALVMFLLVGPIKRMLARSQGPGAREVPIETADPS